MKCITIKSLIRIVTNAVLLLSALTAAMVAQAGQTSAPVLLYHHVSKETPASTSVSPETFSEHLAYIAENHTVLPLSEIVDAARNGKSLPDNALAITFDDGYANILKNAHPALQKHGFPYTIFINPQTIDTRADQLTWQQVKAMSEEGVTFANHTADHLHMLDRKPGESEKAWLERVWQNVEQAQQKLASHIDDPKKYLAYPFGEYNQRLAQKVKQAGYVGFGQHSGAIGPHSDFAALPRFPSAGPYANLKSLKTKMNSLAMPVSSSSVTNPELTRDEQPETVSLTIEGEDVRLEQATCYYQGNAIDTRVRENTLTFTLNRAIPIGRSRVNCTAPSSKHSGKYYWYSQPFFVASKDGTYPD